MKILTAITILVLLTSCTANSVDSKAVIETPKEAPKTETPAKKIKSCMCVKMWMPVCGDDKKTYGNSCEAECAGVKFTMGECQAVK